MTTKIRIAACLAPVAAAFMLQGCVAALPVLVSAGAHGLFAYKEYQSSGGGTVRVSFDESSEVADAAALAEIKSPGIWPQAEAQTVLAGELETSGKFAAVITPATIAQELAKQNRSQDIALFTEAERLRIMREISDATGADAMISIRTLGTEGTARMIRRNNITTNMEVVLYSRTKDKVILRTQMDVVAELGAPQSIGEEVQRVAGQAVAEKVVSFKI